MKSLEASAKKMIEIRAFEETLLELFGENKLSGTTHTYIGEEAIAVGLMEHIKEEDKIFSNHRCHGHFLAYGGPKEMLLAEIMSKKSGMCQGRGGSQHIHYKNFYSNGIQGGIVPNALGVAMADKLSDRDGITVVFIGDGTLGQGVVYESFNMAALYQCPVLFVVEDNGYAMSTKVESAVSGSIKKRPEAFGIQSNEITSNDVEELSGCFEKAVSYVRENKKPFCQIVHTYRLAAHSKGDDFRDKSEVDEWRKKDPISIVKARLGENFCAQYSSQIKDELKQAVENIEKEEIIDLKNYTDSYLNKIEIKNKSEDVNKYLASKDERVLSLINECLDAEMQMNKNTIILGEDICDPYGGAFRITKGLSTKYQGRVINTPISEAGVAGMCVGLALNGMRPIMEVMFGDFVLLCMDQIINHACKYGWVYGEEVSVPAVFRVPSGAGRGYGPTHSQSLEKYLIGVPLLTVVALSPVYDVKQVYKQALDKCNNPLVIIENKKMYAEKCKKCIDGRIGDFRVKLEHNYIIPTMELILDEEQIPDVTLVTYGGMTQLAMDVAEELMLTEEIQVDVVVLGQLAPLPVEDVKKLVKSECIVTLEEANGTAGIGSEIIAVLGENHIGKKFHRISADEIPIPNGIELETQMMPSKEKVVSAVKKIVR